MANQDVTFDRFFGGISSSDKEGTNEGTQTFNKSIEIREDIATFTLLPKTAKESGSTVTGLVKDFEPIGTDMYSYADDGKIHKRTSGASWSTLRTVANSSGNGLGYFAIDDFLYYAGDKLIGSYGPISGTPAFNDDFFTDGTYDLDQNQSASGQTYTTPTSIDESSGERLTFIPDRDPQLTVQVNVAAVGSGNWTLTVHDAADTEVAALTIVNGSVSTGDQKFTFASVWRPVLGATYHFHVISTVADGTVTTADSGDLETVDFSTFYQVLVNDTDFHPVTQFLGPEPFIAIGNERYVATWDGIVGGGNTNYHANRIQLPGGWKVRDLESTGEYLVIAAWKGSTITDFEESIIFFWDGIGTTFNFFIPIKEGVVTAMTVQEGRLFYITSKGNIYEYNGQITKLHRIPKLTQKTYVDVFPEAMTMWQGLIRIGTAGDTNSTVVEQGVYTWGSINKDYPESLSYDYPISTGTTTGTSLKIGAVGVRGDTLFIGWDDNGTFGVDTVTTTANPFASGAWESLKMDNSKPWKEKEALVVKASHAALNANESVQVGYKIDRASSFTTDTANSTDGKKTTRFNINKPYREIEVTVIPATTTTTSPRVTGVVFEFEDNEEQKFR